MPPLPQCRRLRHVLLLEMRYGNVITGIFFFACLLRAAGYASAPLRHDTAMASRLRLLFRHLRCYAAAIAADILDTDFMSRYAAMLTLAELRRYAITQHADIRRLEAAARLLMLPARRHALSCYFRHFRAVTPPAAATP